MSSQLNTDAALDHSSSAHEGQIIADDLYELPFLGRADDLEPATQDYEVLARFRHALRRYLAESERLATGAGLTAQRYQALLAIRTRPQDDPISVGELAQQLVVRPHSAAELVARLESADLIHRSEDSRDRRRVLLHLSEEGHRRLAALAQQQIQELALHRETFRRLVDLLPAD